MLRLPDRPDAPGWKLRDCFAAAALFIATAATVLRQNARVAVLWDISYILDHSFRFALAASSPAQMPYRDFPFSYAPLTFLIQATIMRITGRVFFHHVLYAAVVGGLGTVLAWRIVLHTLEGRLRAAWLTALLLAMPLTVLGIYGIFPTPFYDCDCVFFILIAVYRLQRIGTRPVQSSVWAFAAGCAVALPLFCKQNIGLPFFLVVYGGTLVLLTIRMLLPARTAAVTPSTPTLWMVLAGASVTVLGAILILHGTVGLANYVHWTVTFAAQRRLPGFADMLGIYRERSLLWILPCVAAALLLLRSQRFSEKWTVLLAFALLAAPFVPPLIGLLRSGDPEDRAAGLLALWPPLLVVAAALALYRLRYILRRPDLNLLLPIALLAAIHGTFLSQQLWGSTYAIWPLFVLLLAQMFAQMPFVEARFHSMVRALAAVVAVTLLICGGLYAFSEDRLSYAQLNDGPLVHATAPALAGMSTRGPWLPAFEQLLDFAAREIPANDGLLLIPGEDPFYFATGRTPHFPVLFFDLTSDPYTPAQLIEAVQAHDIRWLIVKRNLQLTDNPLPQREMTMPLLMHEFDLYRRLDNYDIYRRP